MVCDFSHLLPAAVEDRPARETYSERSNRFAAEMERVAAAVDGRKPRALVEGPKQGVYRVTGDELAAAARQRNAKRERAASVRRAGLVG